MKSFFIAFSAYALAGLVGVSFAQELAKQPNQNSGTQVHSIKGWAQ
jgi:hypothetical protein